VVATAHLPALRDNWEPKVFDNPSRSLFFLARGDRLAARLKHILFAWRFVRQVNGTLIVGWPQRTKSLYETLPSEYYSPSLIFNLAQLYADGSTSDIIFIEGQSFGNEGFASFPPLELSEQMPYALQRDYFSVPRGPYQSDSYFLRFADEQKADVNAQVKALYAKLPKSQLVVKLLDEAHRTIGSDRYVALHVRRGDIVGVLQAAAGEMAQGKLTGVASNYAIHLAKQSAPLAFYHDKVEAAIAAGLPILFFSDTPELYREVRQRFAGANIVDASRIARSAAHPLVKAFIDFTLIGAADHVIGTQTGFASVACMLGGAPQVIVTARGNWDEFCRFLYEDILGGFDIPAGVRAQLEAVTMPEYMRYYERACKMKDNLN